MSKSLEESIRKDFKLKFNEVLNRMYNLEIVPNIQATINERIPKKSGFMLFESKELEDFILSSLAQYKMEIIEIIENKIQEHPMEQILFDILAELEI